MHRVTNKNTGSFRSHENEAQYKNKRGRFSHNENIKLKVMISLKVHKYTCSLLWNQIGKCNLSFYPIVLNRHTEQRIPTCNPVISTQLYQQKCSRLDHCHLEIIGLHYKSLRYYTL